MSKQSTRKQLPTKSVSYSFAQINHLCAPGSGSAISQTTTTASRFSNSLAITPYDIILNLQADYGLRISEVLAIKGTDITKSGLIKIKGLKKSANRIIKPSKFHEWWNLKKGTTTLVFDSINRFNVYHEYKKRNICIQVKGRKKKAVTHAFRHILINELRNSNTSEYEISQFTGHKAEKNTALYGKIGD